MTSLLARRCFHHPEREAAARCLSCQRTFCRECVTEHEDRVLCVTCLARPREAAAARRNRGRSIAGGAAGLLLAWLFFFLFGRALALLPSSFHEGTLFTSEPESEADGS